jgi:hypothetical protein
VDWDRFFSLHEDRREVDEDDLYERVSEDIEHQDYWKEIDSETEFCKTRKVCHDDLDQWAKENNKDYGFHTVLELGNSRREQQFSWLRTAGVSLVRRFSMIPVNAEASPDRI